MDKAQPAPNFSGKNSEMLAALLYKAQELNYIALPVPIYPQDKASDAPAVSSVLHQK